MSASSPCACWGALRWPGRTRWVLACLKSAPSKDILQWCHTQLCSIFYATNVINLRVE